ncbi:hypothetical protein BWQ96_06515 [Gracilariopsis chorda]|uniref:Uncharacterized protein n=1 Tax=Gracilariopsis chorda TaxID=448386 RepID=A0A2V3INS9_9FLOR|nr:hypothetical protein BWQ96_06515 [Gracilariopsis chorda]|eukprot:PXF43738.1 hypothetical protein BWQ96_06515 [Gracilariopsis chorda]
MQRIETLEFQPQKGDLYSAYYERMPVPGINELKKSLQEDVDEKGLEVELKRKNDRNCKWRALRTLKDEDVAALRKLSEAPNFDLDVILDPKSTNGASAADLKGRQSTLNRASSRDSFTHKFVWSGVFYMT